MNAPRLSIHRHFQTDLFFYRSFTPRETVSGPDAAFNQLAQFIGAEIDVYFSVLSQALAQF